MALVGNTTEEKIWNFLIARGLNNYGAAGLMGNLYAESALISNSLQNTFEKKLGYTDKGYTEAVDNGSYTKFVKDSAGYGLAQWTYWSRKKNLLDYTKAANKSIGDLEAQLGFLFKELSEDYDDVLDALKTATTVLGASNVVLIQFERPADQSSSMQTKRARYGQVYYDKYAKNGTIKNNEEDIKMAIDKDNTPSDWAKEAVEWAVDNKILFGDEKGNYQLGKACTRQEMIVFLDRLYKLITRNL